MLTNEGRLGRDVEYDLDDLRMEWHRGWVPTRGNNVGSPPNGKRYTGESVVAQSGLMPNSSSHSQPVPPVGLVGNYKMCDNPQTWQRALLALTHQD